MNTVGEPYSGKPNVRIDEGRPGEAVPNRAAYSTADALSAPVWVLARHGGDQRADFGLQSRSPERMTRPPVPEQAPALTMPAQHGLGLDQAQVAWPVTLETTYEEPEELVPSPEAGTMPGAEGDLELLAEEQVLDDEALTAADGG